MSKPVKRSVAVVVEEDGKVLAIRRPDNDDELPGVWGLPAGSYRDNESLDDLIARIGRDKLGVKLNTVRCLAKGTQERTRYRLEMELWEALMEGRPNHPEWRWTSVELLRPGAAAGSLCCELAIKAKSRVSS